MKCNSRLPCYDGNVYVTIVSAIVAAVTFLTNVNKRVISFASKTEYMDIN